MVISKNEYFARAINRYFEYWAPIEFDFQETIIIDEGYDNIDILAQVLAAREYKQILVIGCRENERADYINALINGSINKVFNKCNYIITDYVGAIVFVKCVRDALIEIFSSHSKFSMLSAVVAAAQCIEVGVELWKRNNIEYEEYVKQIKNGRSEYNRFKNIYMKHKNYLVLAGFSEPVFKIDQSIKKADDEIKEIFCFQIDGWHLMGANVQCIRTIYEEITEIQKMIIREWQKDSLTA